MAGAMAKILAVAWPLIIPTIPPPAWALSYVYQQTICRYVLQRMQAAYAKRSGVKRHESEALMTRENGVI
jgi:hypothetical protein